MENFDFIANLCPKNGATRVFVRGSMDLVKTAHRCTAEQAPNACSSLLFQAMPSSGPGSS